MITCTHCNTSHPTFQPTCPNCGAALPPSADNLINFPTEATLTEPPPPPRDAPRHFIQRIMLTEGWSIVALVFLILGLVFTLVGVGLIVAVVTAFVGIPFLGLGILFLIFSLPMLVWRYRKAYQTLQVFQTGEATLGEIVEVHQNLAVRINRRHPWVIRFRFQVGGHAYEGQFSTINPAAANYQPQQSVYILYLFDDPHQNTIYPSLYT